MLAKPVSLLQVCSVLLLTLALLPAHHPNAASLPSSPCSEHHNTSLDGCLHILDVNASQAESDGSCNINVSSDAVSELSLCPWTSYVHTDVNRIPKHINAAKCRCQKCAIPESLNVCSPIYRVMNVLRYDTDQGSYVHAWDKVPIACTCHAPQIQYVNAKEQWLQPSE
ncbi:uncharacterized protein LOC115225871 [Octopus sinensis]|uniref:Uncharacterized protein LOC115225871 n=1 Tax=Octopus sinensis TaxID=2607531 RepID=A0A6P7TTQ3_9MOLL|nr:uncharacterized protein LOC115225871 [Octopus sinensis]